MDVDTKKRGSGRHRRWVLATLAVVAIATAACFWPLTQYFLAQDDFVLLLNSSANPRQALLGFFDAMPGQFRPLSKVFYFFVMEAAFGLRALAFHIVSLLFHILNSALFYLFLRRLRLGAPESMVATACLGLNVGFFHVIAWASCIQQLLAQSFVLLSLITGVDSLRSSLSRTRIASLLFFVLALMSLEQAIVVPPALALVIFLGLRNGVDRRSIARIYPHIAILVLYAVFMMLWKSVPVEGTYQFHTGVNVWINLGKYLGWAYPFADILPAVMTAEVVRPTPSHAILVFLVGYLLFAQKKRELVFGLLYFIVTISPLLFLREHTFYLHTYLPSIGTFYLAAVVLGDIFDRVHRRAPAARYVTALVIILVLTGLCFAKVRQNEAARFRPNSQFKRSFVLRRAAIAKETHRTLSLSPGEAQQLERVYMVFERPEGRDVAQWNYVNVLASLGNGAAVKLFANAPDLQVEFKIVGDYVEGYDPTRSRVFVFDDFGRCRRYDGDFPTGRGDGGAR